MDGPAAGYAIELRSISKRFGAVQANSEVSLRVPAASVHGIVGENGAGKSTLMSILYGFYEADSGEIRVDGSAVRIRGSRDAIKAGIGMVHQHFMLVENFTVLENVILGVEGGWSLLKGLGRARRELARLEREYGLKVQVESLVEDLSVGQRQRVEILKALYRGARILILDEPTGVLTPQETDQLFRILRALKDQGVTIILITHKLREIMGVTDNVAVMRAGRMVAHRVTAETDESELAELMVGRKVLLEVAKSPARPGTAVLGLDRLTVRDSQGVTRVDGVSFEVRSGEIVGVAGVAGNGQSELLETLAGIRRVDGGGFRVGDTTVDAGRPLDAAALRHAGVAHVPEDRHRMGLVTAFSAAESSILGYHRAPEYNGRVFLNGERVRQSCQSMMDAYDVRPPDPGIRSGAFSGGNQQKLVLAREMEKHPLVLLIGQPTRGVDIGAIEFIHRRLVELRDAGAAVLLVSVELEEILSLSDRILVMFEGRVVGTVAASDADPRMLGLMMANAWAGSETAPSS